MSAKILVADDDKGTRLLQEKILRAEGFEVLTAGDGTEAWQMVRLHSPDLVLCDWMMPGLDGLEVCRKIKADPLLRATYVILVTAKEQGEDKVSALEAGADEFLTKPVDVAELKVRVKVGLRSVEYQKSLRDTALTDDLTGLFNRRAFQVSLQREAARARRYRTPLSLLVIDVNRFKTINDRFGHDRGDKVLRIVAQRIGSVLRGSDLLFRIGGDEFAVLLPEAQDKVQSAVARLRRVFGERDDEKAVDPDSPTISVGGATYDGLENTEDLFRRADADMYDDKARPHSPMTGRTSEAPRRDTPESVLLVQGEAALLQPLAQRLRDEGYSVLWKPNGVTGDR